MHSEEHTLVENVFAIHRQLSRLVLEGANLSALADLLARLLQRAVTIEIPELRLLAHAEYGEIDSARADSIREAQTPIRLRQILKNQGMLDLMQSTQQPVVLEPEPSGGMTMQRVIAPIIVGTERYGYVWIIAGDRPLTEVDLVAIESAAIVAALIILRDRVAQAGEERLRSDLLIRLIHADLQSVQELLTHFRRLGFDLGKASQILVCTLPNSGMEEIHFLHQDVSNIVSQLAIQGLVTNEDGYIIVLFLPKQYEAESYETNEGARLAQALLQKEPSLRIGLSEICRTVGDIQHTYQQMCEALMVAEHLHLQQPIITTRDVGYLNILSKVPREAVSSNLYYQRILSLEAYDEQSRAELVTTLEAFLEAGGNSTRTAETLFVHRGTIHYRLGIVEDLIQMDLSDPLIQLNLIIALKLHRLRNLIL